MNVETLTTAIGNITDIMGEVVTTIAGNPVLMTFFCAGLVGTAIELVKSLK